MTTQKTHTRVHDRPGAVMDQDRARRLGAALEALGARSGGDDLAALGWAVLDIAEAEAIDIGGPMPPALLDLEEPAHLGEETAAVVWRAERLARNIAVLAEHAASTGTPDTARIWATAQEQIRALRTTLQSLQAHGGPAGDAERPPC
ncbi:hypothetical protein [Streptomyces sp. G-5]|uniref:hypothetical protein n=1 Tax=Streptomyces sp. G-5 TaxID=2977231 RepID=UPI0021D2E7A2|nr:hypothetical protein [Streptomyces sp. G-5]MCU4750237.1 hypothetical protein [Streptomyces sp. G-5]